MPGGWLLEICARSLLLMASTNPSPSKFSDVRKVVTNCAPVMSSGTCSWALANGKLNARRITGNPGGGFGFGWMLLWTAGQTVRSLTNDLAAMVTVPVPDSFVIVTSAG